MVKVRFKRSFRYALQGVDVVTYPAGSTMEVPAEVARAALEQGVAEKVSDTQSSGSKATTGGQQRATGAQTKANQGASGGGAKVEEQGGS